jgi:ribonucleoside-diphosphate reductase beta chain
MTALTNLDLLPREVEIERQAPVVAVPPQRRAILDPGLDLTLRPMRYPEFYERYRDAIRNTWSVEEIDWTDDLVDLRQRILPAERHLIRRLVAFFATGDSIVSNNLVLNLYKHINSPEARLFLSRQLFEEAQHVQFYLTLLDTYVPDLDERAEAFAAIEHIPSIRAKAEFCFRWMDGIGKLERLVTAEDRQTFLLNMICFGACIEGLFFFASFAYVYFLRSKGLFNGLASGTNWVFRDESGHMDFAYSVIDVIRSEEPGLFDAEFSERVVTMINEAVEVEAAFAADVLAEGISGLSLANIRQYLGYVADQRLVRLGIEKHYGSKNPLDFMMLQDVAEHTNFFERTVSSYQMGVEGDVAFDEAF